MIKTIIFDFDGVILDSMGIKSEAFAEVYKPYGDEIVKKVVEHHEANGGMSRYKKFEYYHKNFLNKDLSEEEKKEMSQKFSEYVMSKIGDAPFVPGVIDFLENNKDRYLMFVSSGTPEYELKETIEMRGITKYFQGIYGSPRSKVEHINEILTKYKLFPQMVLFIGDGTRDREAAIQTKINFLARISYKGSPLESEEFKIYDFKNAEDVIAMIEQRHSFV